MLRILIILFFPILLFSADVKLQVLGSGGPELDSRASASYLIWIDGKAKILVDFGGGAFVRLGQSGAKLKDIDLILLSHFHIDHVADFAALVKAGYFSERTTPIHVFGPSSNRYFPDTKTFLEEQFEEDKVYGYMEEVLDPKNTGISFIPYVF
ncbi:MAG: MBL fold metallo-hydrolase, partial [Thiovulaceae bacterium]|nr:MBL fold metallo-hydrolase [Sulfurimonadaceae bacterium]